MKRLGNIARRSARSRRFERGSLLLETVLAMFIMSVSGLVLISFVQKTVLVSFKAREQATCSRMVQSVFSRIKNIDFYYVFNADSAQANNGIQAGYPYQAVLNGASQTLADSRFDRFTIDIDFVRRDFSDANSNGLTSDLIDFTDANSDLIDDYDPNIKFNDQNGDLDYWDTYTSGGRTVAEQPDTHIKRVTLKIYRRDRIACTQTELVSLEQFSGEPNPSSEAILRLLLSAPVNSSYLYSMDTAQQQDAVNLAISKSYPAEVAQYRADTTTWLDLAGETDPLSTVRFYVGSSGELANTDANAVGDFTTNPSAVSAAFVEGGNTLQAQSTKDAYTSPITQRTLIKDINPPTASGATPTGTIATFSPYVAVTLTDAGTSTTTTSGICPDVITMTVEGSEVTTSFNDGVLVWIDSTTQASPVLSTGTSYNVVVEAGDYAGYKISTNWSFTLDVPVTDNSAPSISNKTPIGMAGSTLPEIGAKIQDNQSGIDPSSILLKIDGVIVVNSSNISTYYDAATEQLTYTPAASYVSASVHTVEVTASHWATSPADKVTVVDSWTFMVP